MNIPNLASFHHFIRFSFWAWVSGFIAFASELAVKEPAQADVLASAARQAKAQIKDLMPPF